MTQIDGCFLMVLCQLYHLVSKGVAIMEGELVRM